MTRQTYHQIHNTLISLNLMVLTGLSPGFDLCEEPENSYTTLDKKERWENLGQSSFLAIFLEPSASPLGSKQPWVLTIT